MMTAEPISDAEVDVCAACGGIWIDWFDGEVRRVAGEVLAGDHARAPSPNPGGSPLRAEAVATGACPRCTRQLVVERYEVPVPPGAASGTRRPAVATPTGAELLRCEECAGVFAPRTSAVVLASLPSDDEPASFARAHAPGGAELPRLEPLPWEKVIALFRRLLGLA